MKKITLIILFCSIATILFAQEDLLIRKWKMVKVSSKKILEYGQKLIDNPDLMNQEIPLDIIEEQVALQQLIDKGTYIEIKKNNVFIFGYYNLMADAIMPIKTSWYYMDSDKKAFNIGPQEVKKVIKNKNGTKFTARSSTKYTVYQIVELTPTKLQLFIMEDNTMLEFSPIK